MFLIKEKMDAKTLGLHGASKAKYLRQKKTIYVPEVKSRMSNQIKATSLQQLEAMVHLKKDVLFQDIAPKKAKNEVIVSSHKRNPVTNLASVRGQEYHNEAKSPFSRCSNHGEGNPPRGIAMSQGDVIAARHVDPEISNIADRDMTMAAEMPWQKDSVTDMLDELGDSIDSIDAIEQIKRLPLVIK